MAGCAVYEDASRAPSESTAGASGSHGGSGSGGSSGGSGTGASGANDGSSDIRGNGDANDASSGGGSSGAAGTSTAGGSSGQGGTAGTGGASGDDGASGAGGSAGSAGSSGGGGTSGSGGISGAAGTSGASGASGADASSGVDISDAGPPCVTGTGPTSLPFAVDQYFVASGWMQATLIHQDAICIYPPILDGGRDGGADVVIDRDGSSMSDRGTVPPLPGSKCWTITYAPTSPTDWAGVDWQYPINNWGASPGLVIPPGAARVSFVAWGDAGGETLSFNVGYGPATSDAFSASLDNQLLTTTPTRFAVDISGIAYTCNSVRMGFGWVARGGATITFHIADVRWE